MQPRTTFEGLEALVELVKEFGLLQPILVRPVAGQPDSYEIVAGERRWRAAQKAQLHDVPVVVRSHGRPGRPAARPDREPAARRPDGDRRGAGLSPPRAGFRPEPRRHRARRWARAGRTSPTRCACWNCRAPSRRWFARASSRRARRARWSACPIRWSWPSARCRSSSRCAPWSAWPAISRRKPRRADSRKPPKSADTRALEKRIEEALGLKAELKLRGLGEQSLLTLEIRDFDQLDAVVDRLTRR